jgi:hypothetical protein
MKKILKPMVNQSPTIKCENMMKLGYFKEDTSTAVGVAKPSAHGQATTCIQDTRHYCMEKNRQKSEAFQHHGINKRLKTLSILKK